MKLRHNHKGDTIMEVLISVAVLSLALVSSYVLASKSSVASIKAREHDEGVKVSETQFERLKSYASNPGYELPPPDSNICMNPNATSYQTLGGFSITGNINPADYAPGGSSCIQTQTGTYYTAIKRGSGVTANTFTVTTRWDRANGGGIEQNQLVYRIYRQETSVPPGYIP